MDIELFGGVPDWIQVGLAILSLGGSVGVGAYRAGVRRTRLDDRRLLLREWTDVIGTLGQRSPGTGSSEPDRVGRIARQRLANLREQDDINSIFQLLPWKDRALWVRHVRHVFQVGGPQLAELMAVSRMLGSDELELQMELAGEPARSEIYTAVETSVTDLDSAVNISLGGFRTAHARPNAETYLELRDHLIRKSNPSILTRWSLMRTSVRLWVWGPRPFSPWLKPRHLAVDYQIQTFAGRDLDFRWNIVSEVIESG